MEENTTPVALPDAAVNPASDADGTVGQVATESMTLAEINSFLGKDFKTKDSALKAVKDTFSYVGKKKEDIEKEVLSRVSNDTKTDALAKELEEMRKERFYDKNPQYADESIRKFIESTGKNPVEVVNTPEFKSIFEKVSGFNETQKLRTVLESNPRLASTKDSFTKAREMQKAGGTKDQVEQLVVRGVLDAFGK